MSKTDRYIIVISAPSGSGKTTIAKKLLANDSAIELSVSATTRKRRENEVDGQDYTFIDLDTFRNMISHNDMAEWAEVHDAYYGTPKTEIERIIKSGKHVLLDIDVQGAMQIKANYSDAITIFIVPPSMEVLEERLKGRGTESKSSVKLRLENAKQEMAHESWYDHTVVNQDVDKAVEDIQSIIS